MRVAVLSSWFPDEDDSVRGVFVEDQAAALSQRYDVAVVAPRVGWRRTAGTGASSAEAVQNVRRFELVRPTERPRVPGSRNSALAAWMRAARSGLLDLSQEWGVPDVIHAHVCLPAGWAAAEIGRELSIPAVLTEHLSRFDPGATAPRQLDKIRTAVLGSSAVIAVSPHLREEMLRFAPTASIDVLGNLVRTDIFTPGPARKDETFRFLAVGILSPQKGFLALIDATRRLLDNGVGGFEIVIGGDGPLRGELERAASGMPIVFAGGLSRAEVRMWMHRSDAVVAPSLRESFGLVAAEAMACGKPVIATACGGPDFVVTPDAGVLVPIGDVERLSDAMAAFIRGEVVFDPTVIRAGVDDRFGEEAFLEGLSTIYERVTRAGH